MDRTDTVGDMPWCRVLHSEESEEGDSEPEAHRRGALGRRNAANNLVLFRVHPCSLKIWASKETGATLLVHVHVRRTHLP